MHTLTPNASGEFAHPGRYNINVIDLVFQEIYKWTKFIFFTSRLFREFRSITVFNFFHVIDIFFYYILIFGTFSHVHTEVNLPTSIFN